jgi:hypothetical protein
MVSNFFRTAPAALLCFLAVLMSVRDADATIIIVVVKSDAIWIGTDGIRTDGHHWSKVCKVHQAYGGILLKHSKDADEDKTFSADEEIQRLIKTKKALGEFQKAAALVYKQNVEKIVEEALRDTKRNHPEWFDGDLLRSKPSERNATSFDMGLVFVAVVQGKLIVSELHVEPIAIPVPTLDGSERYRWVVAQPTWETKPTYEEAYAYPSTPIQKETRTWLIANPIVRIPDLIMQSESKFPCNEAPPNVLLKVSPATADPKTHYTASARKQLMNTAKIEYIEPGACPSWKANPTPAICTFDEFKREINGR